MKILSELNIGSVIGTESITNDSELQKNILNRSIEHIKEWSNIPCRYEKAEFIAKNEKQEKLISELKANFNGKKFKDINDMLIYGTVGTGKTHLIVAMLHKLINANIYCRYATEHHLLDMYFQKKYSDFDGFKKVSVLVIDELGKRELQDWQKIQLEELISYRYNNMLPTIYITNMEMKEFKKFVGNRVEDRLRENKVIRVLMDGESLRGSF